MTTTGKKITDFASLTNIADSDILLAVDTSDTTSSLEGTTKKILFSEVKGNITSGLNVSNWDLAYSWGNHAGAGYLSSFTETDPVFTAHHVSDITTTQIGQWNTAYGWGNHAVQGYLQSIGTQSINSLSDVNTSGVSTDDVLKWNGASWVPGVGGGSGGVATLNDVGNVTISSATTGQVLKWSGTAWTNQAEAGGIALGDLSVTVASAGTANLSYNNGTGEFTYTPPDLSSTIALGDLSVTVASAGTANLSYNNGTGEFTYTPPDLSSYLQNINEDASPQLGANLDLNSNNITGSGDINVTGDLKGDTIRLTNNSTTPGSGNKREIKVIGHAPYFYDGTDWRPFFLIDSPTQVAADTDWGNVMIRSTFDTDITDVKYNVTPAMKWDSNSTSTSISVVSAPVKVGVKSVRINGGAQTLSRLQYPMTSNYDFTGAWTMEAWVYFDSGSWSTTAQSIFSGDGASGEFNLLARSDGGGDAIFSWRNTQSSSHNSGSGTSIGSFADNTIVGAWAHVALVKDSNDALIKLYINGSQIGSSITDNDIENPDNFNLGGHYGSTNDYNFDGFLDDVRIAKSTRYTANFTAPTSQLPVSGSTTQILPPPADKKGEITLGSSPTWKGSPGITVAQQSSGTYRLTFSSAYSNADDYFIIAQGMDHGSNASSYIRVARTTGYVDLIVKSQADDTSIDTGAIGIQLINNN